MSKTKASFGNPVFGQLISYIPKDSVASSIQQHETDRYTKKFKTWDHLVAMLFSAMSGCSGLREVESGFAGFRSRLLHLGVSSFPIKSTLSDANKKRTSAVFESIFKATYEHLQPYLPDSYPKNQEWMKKLFLVDSTTITLFNNIMKACGRPPANGRKKGGVKIHVGMHLSESTPSLVRITSAATHDKTFMQKFKHIDPDTILVFDKAYVNFNLYNHWTQSGVKFVTKLHRHCVYEVTQENVVDQEQQKAGVYRDQEILLGHRKQADKVRCRLISFYDEEKNRVMKFITNDLELAASVIAEIYRQRWQIELLFKRLKQNLQLSDFLGDNENAIKIQIWCNLLADLLLTVVRKGMKRKRAYSNVAGLIRIHLMNYVKVNELLSNPCDRSIFEQKQMSEPKLNFPQPP